MPRAAGRDARGPAGRVCTAPLLGRGARHARVSARRRGGRDHQHRGRNVPGAQPVSDAAAAGAGRAGRAGAERDGCAACRRRCGGHGRAGAGAGHPGRAGKRSAGRGAGHIAGHSRARSAGYAARPVARAGPGRGAGLRAHARPAACRRGAQGGSAACVRGDAVARRRTRRSRAGGGTASRRAHGARDRAHARRGTANCTLCAGGQADAVFHPAADAARAPAQRAHRPRAHGAVYGLPRDGGAARQRVLPDVSRRRAVPEPPARTRHRMACRRGGRRAFGAGRKAAAARAGTRGRVCRRRERGGVSAGDPGAVFLSLCWRTQAISRVWPS